MQKLIIDGYNVIHADPRMKKTTGQDLERARAQLVERTSEYLRGKHMRVTIVFDGRGVLTDVESVVPGKLQILYSSTPESADDLIIKTLRDSPNPQEYIVVTSDMADIGRSARGMGANILSSQAFLKRITRGSDATRQPTADGGAVDVEMKTQDLDYWLDQFNSAKDDGG